MRKSLAALGFIMAVSASATAFAADHKVDWATHCKAELEKFKIDANGDDETIYQALLKHDKELGKDCDENAHSKYEKLTGK